MGASCTAKWCCWRRVSEMTLEFCFEKILKEKKINYKRVSRF